MAAGPPQTTPVTRIPIQTVNILYIHRFFNGTHLFRRVLTIYYIMSRPATLFAAITVFMHLHYASASLTAPKSVLVTGACGRTGELIFGVSLDDACYSGARALPLTLPRSAPGGYAWLQIHITHHTSCLHWRNGCTGPCCNLLQRGPAERREDSFCQISSWHVVQGKPFRGLYLYQPYM